MIKRIIGLALLVLITACSKKASDPELAPGTANLVAPIKDQICTTGTVVSSIQSTISFSWSKAENADSYEVTVKNLLTQTETKQSATGTQTTVTLARNTPYSWYVTSKSQSSSTTTKSDVWKFYNSGAGIVTYAPYPADLLAPTFGQIITPTNGKINLSWKGSSVDNNIVSYNVYFGPSKTPDLFKLQTKDSFVNDISVSANTTYYWTIISIDSNGNISASPTYNFFVK